MKHQLLDILRCPDCSTPFDLQVTEEEHGQVKTGRLTCRGSAPHSFAISRFVPRFVDADQYADSFSRQRLYVRKHFRYYEADRSGDELFFPTTGFSPDRIKSGLSLEIGTGYGRFVDVVQRAGGRIVGVDLSTHSIDLAHDFTGLRENVFLVQADLFRLPFARQAFDQVFSIGVLHHTPDTAKAFAAIAPFAAPGGDVSIWVYHPSRKVSANRWRVVTSRMNHRLLYGFCVMNQVLFSWIRALPGGARFNELIPGAVPRKGRPFWLRVLGDFDNLSPVYAYVHDEAEVVGWFERAGLVDVRSLPRLTAVTGRRATS
jgi:SAM-dependent methyltransferase